MKPTTPAQQKKYAGELIGLAQEHLEQYSIIGAIEHVYQMAADRQLPWACSEVLNIAEDAIDQARAAWITAKHRPMNFRTGRAEIETAQADGFDLIGIACELIGGERKKKRLD